MIMTNAGVTIIGSILILGVCAFAGRSCAQMDCFSYARNMERKQKFSFLTGCYIQSDNGKYIPLSRYRYIQGDID